ncbi:MAG TPA: hypothetical protein VIL36_07115 [Acidimicrobiales bacterium]
MGLDVRRLAAVDMHGSKGHRARAVVILGEFLFGATAGPLFGLFVVATGATLTWKVIGVLLLGIGLNYVPAARHALDLRAPGALAAELEGVDIKAELRRYSVLQFWVCVPFAVLVFDRRQRERAVQRDAGSATDGAVDEAGSADRSL